MDAIRLRQIREALDTDKRMYAAAFELEKRRVARMDEKPDDQTAAQQGSLETVGEALSELKENWRTLRSGSSPCIASAPTTRPATTA